MWPALPFLPQPEQYWRQFTGVGAEVSALVRDAYGASRAMSNGASESPMGPGAEEYAKVPTDTHGARGINPGSSAKFRRLGAAPLTEVAWDSADGFGRAGAMGFLACELNK